MEKRPVDDLRERVRGDVITQEDRRHRLLLIILSLAIVVGLSPALNANELDDMPSIERNGERSVTIRFSYYVDSYAANRPESEVRCSLTLPRGSDGVEVLLAAVDQDCIRSFRTVRDSGRVRLHCINHVCARVTNSAGMVPDTRWNADWTDDGGEGWDSEYWNFGLHGFSASDGNFFTAYLYAVN